MAWARIHDGAMSNPKLLGLIDWRNGFCVWVWGLSYCQLQLTDGVIPHAALPNKTATRTAEQLVAAGLWSLHPAGFLVHDFLDWNDSRAQILKKRQEAKERMGNARRRSREHTGERSHERSREPPANVPRTFSREVLRGVDLQNVPRNEDDPVRANTPPRVELEPAESLRWFDRVYAVYPNKERKVAANEAWVALAPDLATAQAIHADIQRRMKAGWVRFERRFIPHLVKFLNERQWEDDPESRALYEEIDDPYARFPHAWQCKKCGEVHEGTAEQHERGECLKSKVS